MLLDNAQPDISRNFVEVSTDCLCEKPMGICVPSNSFITVLSSLCPSCTLRKADKALYSINPETLKTSTMYPTFKKVNKGFTSSCSDVCGLNKQNI